MDRCLRGPGFAHPGEMLGCLRATLAGSFQVVMRDPGFATADDWVTVGLTLLLGIGTLVWLATRAVRAGA